MKLTTVASTARTSAQNRDALNRGLIAAVAPTDSAATTVRVAVSTWNNGNGQ